MCCFTRGPRGRGGAGGGGGRAGGKQACWLAALPVPAQNLGGHVLSPSRAPPSPTPPTPPRPASPPSFQYVQHLRQCPLSVVVGVSGGWCVPRVAEGGWPLVGFPPGPPSFFLFGGGSCSSWDLRYPTRLSFATPLPPPPPAPHSSTPPPTCIVWRHPWCRGVVVMVGPKVSGGWFFCFLSFSAESWAFVGGAGWLLLLHPPPPTRTSPPARPWSGPPRARGGGQ